MASLKTYRVETLCLTTGRRAEAHVAATTERGALRIVARGCARNPAHVSRVATLVKA